MLPERFRRTVPWRLGDLYLVIGSAIIGIVLIAMARVAVRDQPSLATEVRWMNVAVTGVIVLGTGIVLWLLAGRRAVGDLRRHLLAQLHAAQAAPTSRHPLDSPSTSEFVTAARMTRYHSPGCLLVAGKSTEAVTPAQLDRLHPCGVCIDASAP
jgi:hypothetical protein